MTRDKIDQFIRTAVELKAELILYYVPIKSMYEADSTYKLYYTNPNIIEIDTSYYRSSFKNSIKITPDNIDDIIHEVYTLMSTDISKHFRQALENLKLHPKNLKAVNEEGELERFKDEICKLLDKNNE